MTPGKPRALQGVARCPRGAVARCGLGAHPVAVALWLLASNSTEWTTAFRSHPVGTARPAQAARQGLQGQQEPNSAPATISGGRMGHGFYFLPMARESSCQSSSFVIPARIAGEKYLVIALLKELCLYYTCPPVPLAWQAAETWCTDALVRPSLHVGAWVAGHPKTASRRPERCGPGACPVADRFAGSFCDRGLDSRAVNSQTPRYPERFPRLIDILRRALDWDAPPS